jgi:hypothetical protein
MKLYILDAETYYDREYNLRRLDPASYILDPRFELIGIAVKEPGIAAYWVEGPDAPGFFASLDPNDIMTVSHNALFDNPIWAYRYGFVPRLMVDTLGVSRAVLSLKSNSLKSVAEHLGLGAKGEEIHQAIGMRLADLKARPDFYRAYVNYALNGTLRHHLLPMVRVDAPAPAKIRCVHSLASQRRDQCQDTASRFIEAVPG